MSSVIPQRSDNEGPQPHMVISAHEESIPALAYLPDGRCIVTGSYDGTVKVWNMDNGEQELEGAAMGHRSNVSSLAVTRDGTKIVSGDDNGMLNPMCLSKNGLRGEGTRSPSRQTNDLSRLVGHLLFTPWKGG